MTVDPDGEDREVDRVVARSGCVRESDEAPDLLVRLELPRPELVPASGDRVQELVRHPLRAEGVEDARRDARRRGAEVGNEAEVRRVEPRVQLAERQHPRRPDGLGGVDLHAELDVEPLWRPGAAAPSPRGVAAFWRRSTGNPRRLHGLELRLEVLDDLVLVEQAVGSHRDVDVPVEARQLPPVLVDQAEEPPLDVGRDVREAAEALEADHLEAGPEAQLCRRTTRSSKVYRPAWEAGVKL